LLQSVAFCQTWIARLHEDNSILDKTIWFDEASSNLRGTVNRHNRVTWHKTNPHLTLEKKMKSKSQAFLACISSQGILGPFFFGDTVTRTTFSKIIKDNVLSQIREKLGHDCWIQMDGAAAYWARSMRVWIDEEFPDLWIGRDGPIAMAT
jgi:hypothetical protein